MKAQDDSEVIRRLDQHVLQYKYPLTIDENALRKANYNYWNG
ncbi:hypothetical protein J2S74_004592 [Evansella vedderi]|uniref:Uncharacterized protein n=1 Tax=Evansella vedderi TaxID=38282 RepID=A0ABU0A0Y8_9BACI|nr:hypothetical protein [Evansella vedderi]MDQ0257146.1 hypothetical protein [Evansella vedderi]